MFTGQFHTAADVTHAKQRLSNHYERSVVEK